MISLKFKPWDKFHAEIDESVFRKYLEAVGKESVNTFRRGSTQFKSGTIYRVSGRQWQASAPGEWPARPSGRLFGSVRYKVTGREVEIGTDVPYATYLTRGTRKMAKRKMMTEALEEGIKKARSRLSKWVEWEKG